MPNIWTHICFCENVVDIISSSNTFFKQESMMKLGAQGPDLFHYYKHQSPRSNSVQYFDKIMRTSESRGFLVDLIESAKNKSKEIQAYLFGFLTHFILEQQTYPFIYSHTSDDISEQNKYKINIDTLFMEKHYNLQTWKVPVHKEVDVGFTIDKEVAQLLQQKITKHFPSLDSYSTKYIQRCYQKMKITLMVTADPYGWKNIVFGSLVSSHSHRPVQDHNDYLNLKRKPWTHPIQQKVYKESFEDLYDQARVKAVELLTEVVSYWQHNDETAKKRINKLLKENAYDTKLNLNNNSSSTYN